MQYKEKAVIIKLESKPYDFKTEDGKQLKGDSNKLKVLCSGEVFLFKLTDDDFKKYGSDFKSGDTVDVQFEIKALSTGLPYFKFVSLS